MKHRETVSCASHRNESDRIMQSRYCIPACKLTSLWVRIELYQSITPVDVAFCCEDADDSEREEWAEGGAWKSQQRVDGAAWQSCKLCHYGLQLCSNTILTQFITRLPFNQQRTTRVFWLFAAVTLTRWPWSVISRTQMYLHTENEL